MWFQSEYETMLDFTNDEYGFGDDSCYINCLNQFELCEDLVRKKLGLYEENFQE